MGYNSLQLSFCECSVLFALLFILLVVTKNSAKTEQNSAKTTLSLLGLATYSKQLLYLVNSFRGVSSSS